MRFPVIPTIFLLLMLQSALVLVPNFVALVPERTLLTTLLAQKSAMQVTLHGDIRLRFLPRPQVLLEGVTMNGQTAGGDRLAVQAPYLLLDLDMTALMRQKFDVSSVSLLYPQIDAQIISPPHRLLGRLQSEANPRVFVEQARLSIIGLNRLNPSARVVVPGLSIELPPRDVSGSINITLRHKLPGGEFGEPFSSTTTAAFRIGTPLGNRYRVSSDIQLGVGERLAFDGFLSAAGMAQSDWHMDGELTLASDNMLAQIMHYQSPLQLAEQAQYIGFNGLVRADSAGLRSNSLEVNALDTVFQSRLSLQWPQRPDAIPELSGRLSTGTLNLDHFSLKPRHHDTPLAQSLWQNLASDLAVTLEVEANRFDLADEEGANLSIDFDWRNGLVDIDRLSLDLPFRSALIAAGTLNLAGDSPSFVGNFSARSLDTLAAMIWLGHFGGRDLSGMAELIDDADLQRVSLVGDLDWSETAFLLTGLTGRFGDDYFSGDVTLLDSVAPRGGVDLQFSRFDLTDWGADAAGTARDINVNSVWQPLNRLLEAQLSQASGERAIDISFTADQLYFGSAALGPAELKARIEDQRLLLTNLRLSNLSGASINADGTLNYDAQPAYGRLALSGESVSVNQAADILLDRLAPLRFVSDAPLRVEADLLLTGRDAPDWPNAKLKGRGLLGDMQLDFNLVTPSRTLDYTVGGSNLAVSLNGGANLLAEAVLLPAIYPSEATGRLQVELAAQSNNVSALAGNLTLADTDTLELSGSLRAAADGPLLDGSVSVSFADTAPLLAGQKSFAPLPLMGRGQLSANAQKIGFSGFTGQFGGGTVTGDGVLQVGNIKPQLNATLRINDADFAWLLPQYGGQGWSQSEMRWSLLDRANADIDMRLSAIRIAALTIDRLDGRLRLVDGVLEIPDLTADLLGGQAKGRLLAEGGQLTPLFNVEAQLTDIGLAAPLTELYGTPLLDASLSGTLNMRARGSSAADMMGALSGDVQVDIGGGQFGFVDMAGLREALVDETRTGPAAPLVAQFGGPGDVRFERGLGLMQWRDGRVNNATAEFVFGAPYGDARLNLNVDVVSRQLVAGLQIFPQPDKPISWQISGDVMQPRISVTATPYDRVQQVSGEEEEAAPQATTTP